MDSAKNSRVLLPAIALIAGLFVVLYWQPIITWLIPTPIPKQKIILAVATYPGSGLVYLAAAKGYFLEEGLDVTLQTYTSGRDALAATIEKNADLGTVANMPVVYATMNGQLISIVTTIFTAGKSYGVVARRDRGIETLADIKGKIVGVTSRTDGHYVFSTMLARHRLLLDQVHIQDISPEEMATALQSGKVDAIATWEPWLSAATQAMGANGIEFRTDGGFVLEYNLAGRSDWVSANQEKIQRVLKALLQAKRFVDDNPLEAHAVIAKAIKIDPAVLNSVGPNYRFVVQLDQNLLIMLEDQARWAVQNKFSNQTSMPNFLTAIDIRALNAIQPDAVKIIH
ncbi:NrtA/SsuA/CpmA family ABC transporter substrate-binding protein [Undibacterium sp. Jales W-56]|uniref:ABC transporter substrate-binding protein n=1 Tax=Undibacterium sp. Jales W-56 TaxID=2897325 RepID=UPI0021CE9B80|nr:NrtA/SsuA/CpmA family ABC transporter substrate-binding protein [Undibacterium sp. Jales W-56]MCU6433361.1 NrtA/SsuA/CpmA family ABC transporter substrate-binding protein [Undibacterium sp. Jales W-56]